MGLFQHDGKLIAAEPRDGVLVAYAGAKDLCDATQHRIAGSMPAAVVHRLETVEIDGQQGGRQNEQPGAIEQNLQTALELKPVAGPPSEHRESPGD